MKNKIILMTVLLYSFGAFSIDEPVFDKLITDIKENNFESVENFLKENEDTSKHDPEYYVLLLNYAIAKGEDRKIVLSSGSGAENNLALHSQETGEVEGYLGERATYDKKLILYAIRKTQKSLGSFPHRLDIHFGVIAAAERIEAFQIVGEQLIRILQISKEIDNKWVWGTINSMHGDPKEFMIQNILPRTSNFFQLNSELGDAQLEAVSRALIKYYPDSIYGHANLGLLYLVKEEYDKAEKYLQHALSIDQNDGIVLANIKKLKALRAQ